ncbi:hypothetical protein DFH27DRAFT_294373 [Peziza echinospora]|nr:hypothetical protein DFH27DRAFT_294373 [Peziza echinospora]
MVSGSWNIIFIAIACIICLVDASKEKEAPNARQKFYAGGIETGLEVEENSTIFPLPYGLTPCTCETCKSRPSAVYCGPPCTLAASAAAEAPADQQGSPAPRFPMFR